jgi:hypothetical protein
MRNPFATIRLNHHSLCLVYHIPLFRREAKFPFPLRRPKYPPLLLTLRAPRKFPRNSTGREAFSVGRWDRRWGVARGLPSREGQAIP